MPAWAAAIFVPLALGAIAATWKLASALTRNTTELAGLRVDLVELRETVSSNGHELGVLSNRLTRVETITSATGATARRAADAADTAASVAQEVKDAVTP